jgi:hypothetical protein
MAGTFKTRPSLARHAGQMSIDIAAARAFMATHARILDRRRFLRIIGEGDGAAATGSAGETDDALVAAADAYRNGDGGYGWGLEPDLRSPESQPGGALHAFEAFAEIAPATTRQAAELCDWLAAVSLADGGLPFAFPVTEPAGCASFWVDADSGTSSLHITAAVTAEAHRVARHDPAVASHPWLGRATEFCLDAITAQDRPSHALELRYSLGFLDAVAEPGHRESDRALALIGRLGTAIPDSGCLHVAGGKDDEMMRPLDFAPVPGRPARSVVTEAAVAADLKRLAGLQQDDGGWPLEWASASPAAALEWRGWLTVRATSILRANGILDQGVV